MPDDLKRIIDDLHRNRNSVADIVEEIAEDKEQREELYRTVDRIRARRQPKNDTNDGAAPAGSQPSGHS